MADAQCQPIVYLKMAMASLLKESLVFYKVVR